MCADYGPFHPRTSVHVDWLDLCPIIDHFGEESFHFLINRWNSLPADIVQSSPVNNLSRTNYRKYTWDQDGVLRVHKILTRGRCRQFNKHTHWLTTQSVLFQYVSETGARFAHLHPVSQIRELPVNLSRPLLSLICCLMLRIYSLLHCDRLLCGLADPLTWKTQPMCAGSADLLTLMTADRTIETPHTTAGRRCGALVQAAGDASDARTQQLQHWRQAQQWPVIRLQRQETSASHRWYYGRRCRHAYCTGDHCRAVCRRRQ